MAAPRQLNGQDSVLFDYSNNEKPQEEVLPGTEGLVVQEDVAWYLGHSYKPKKDQDYDWVGAAAGTDIISWVHQAGECSVCKKG
ncbi:MAG: hypothetical protein H7A36_03530 [Chlamydiales bacterium]|nr:hypothetical protein [Chlamydiales bacterium]